MSVIEEKKALRTFIRKKERTLAPAYKAESSEAICRHLLALDEYKNAKIVFAFAGTEKEIDTSLFMNETIAAGKTLILPRCAAEHAIDLCVVRSMDDLEAGAYGIQGYGSMFVSHLDGDYFCVMGLPVCTLAWMLRDAGVRILGQA